MWLSHYLKMVKELSYFSLMNGLDVLNLTAAEKLLKISANQVEPIISIGYCSG
jgi:hypothetical protein